MSDTRPAPPVAEKIPVARALHGDVFLDDYAWMRDKADPRVRAYLEAENAYTDAVLAPTEPLRKRLYDEMLGRIEETDSSVPYRRHGDYFYRRTETGKAYPILCRRRGSLEADEQIILDVNALAESESFMAVGAATVSDDGRLLAYTTDTTGFRDYTLHIKNLDTGELLVDRVERVTSVAWAADNATLMYTVTDAAKRPYQLHRRAAGSEGAGDVLYEETDERFRLGVERSRSGGYFFLLVASHTATEVWYALAADGTDALAVVAPRADDHEYYADHAGDSFYVMTNDRGRNFRVVTAPVTAPGRDRWSEVRAHSDAIKVEDIVAFDGHLVVGEREAGVEQVRVVELASGDSHRIAFPDPIYSASSGANPELDSGFFRLHYQSLTAPNSVYDYDFATRTLSLRKREPVLGGFDADDYVSERIFATAPDGTAVPISLVSRRGVPRDGSAPMLLVGYGSYGGSYDPTFSSMRLSLLDRGVVYGIAHLRGGGEMGKPWHDAGRMLNKKNTFTDFIAVAEHLIAQKVTSADRLAIWGASAGGLLLGVVLNLRPELFAAAVVGVPFVDVINTMLDETLPLTVGEFEEWGNPKVAEHYAYMRDYTPYENVGEHDYPAMLVDTSFNDSQVMYWEPAKWVARLRRLKTDDNPLLLHTVMEGGHGGPSGRYSRLEHTAFKFAFVLWSLGVAE